MNEAELAARVIVLIGIAYVVVLVTTVSVMVLVSWWVK
jgi:hypothetical protein